MNLQTGHSITMAGRTVGQHLALPWRVHYGYVMLPLGLAVVTTALGLGRYSYSVILPSMKEGLGLTYAQAGLISTAEIAGYTVFALVCGVLAGRLGPRKVVAAGLFLAGGTIVLLGLAAGFEVALLARLLTGIGAAGANIAALSLVSRWFDRSRRGLAMGIFMTGSPVGLVIVGLAGPRILAASGEDGWRYCWVYFGLLALGVAAAAALLVRNYPRDKGLLPLWAKEEGNGKPVPAPVAGQAGLRSVCRLGCVWHMALISAMHGFAVGAPSVFFVSHLVKQGVTLGEAGSLWPLIGFVMLFTMPSWGFVSDVVGRRRAMMLGFFIETAALALLAVSGHMALFVAATILIGISFSGPSTVVLSSVGDYVEDRMVPTVIGLTSVAFGVAMGFAPAVTGALADATGTFTPGIWLGAAVTLGGVGVTFALRPPGVLPWSAQPWPATASSPRRPRRRPRGSCRRPRRCASPRCRTSRLGSRECPDAAGRLPI